MTSPQANLPPLRASAVTLVDTVIPRVDGSAARAVRDVILIVAGAALTALAAQVSFTVGGNPVPYTLQTAAVLLTGTALGAGRGFASMLLYVVAGAVGIGVFADGRSGLMTESGSLTPTLGYLVAFVVAATLCGRLAQRQWERTRSGAFLLMLLGSVVIYLIGVPVLALVAGMAFSEAIYWGALVFIPWDLAKVVVATFAFPFAWRVAGDRTGE
ncbi:MAG: biotin transporter BioY [Candidatus Limnocylindria bacterium]